MDSILNYPIYNALVSAFAIPGTQNMSALVDIVGQVKEKSAVMDSSSVCTQTLRADRLPVRTPPFLVTSWSVKMSPVGLASPSTLKACGTP